jgi:hypothetical protein
MNTKHDAIVLPEWKEIVNQAMFWNYGDLKTHEEIANMVYLKHTTQKYRTAIAKANKKLIEHGKMLKCVRNQGYIVIAPDEYLNESYECKRKAVKQFDTSHQILENAPLEHMAEEARKKHLIAYDRSSTLQSMLHGGLKQIGVITEKKNLRINSGKE